MATANNQEDVTVPNDRTPSSKSEYGITYCRITENPKEAEKLAVTLRDFNLALLETGNSSRQKIRKDLV